MSSEYFEYLRSRSITGLLYRKYWLYPRLSNYLSGRILDIGCGIGDFLSYCPGAIGVDINPEAVEWCRRKGMDARLMRIDQLPFESESFNGVVLDNVLEHLLSPTRLLGEVHRILCCSGRFIVGVPGARGYSSDPDHKVYYDESRLDGVLGNAGFGKLKSFYMPLKCDYLSRRLPQYCLYGVYERV